MNATDKAKRIRLLVLDVDGVLTDGGLYYDAAGQITKRFHVQDGLGIKMAQAAGLQVAVITGLSSEAVHARIKELDIKEYYDGHTRKIPLLEKIARDNGLSFEEIAYMGDDWVDAAPMARVGLSLAVANAQPEILEMADWSSRAPGGNGAVREAVNFILKAQGKFDAIWNQWLP